MAELDISERRLPQDGRIKIKIGGGKEMDFRVSVCPTLFGEKVVMRLLDKSNLQLDMTKLGFDPKPLALVQGGHRPALRHGAGHRPHRLGQDDHALLGALRAQHRPTPTSATAEDPVEFNFAGINQVQMHEDIGLNFAAALRSFLRQDPDIIMVGEIRDFETAEIAVKAALTGHLVLSTLHTNDAPGTVTRLLNMGIEPFLVTASLNLILAQRLVPQALPGLQEAGRDVDEQALHRRRRARRRRSARFTVYEPAGCRDVQRPRLQGRVAIYEVMPFWDGLKELVINGASTAELSRRRSASA